MDTSGPRPWPEAPALKGWRGTALDVAIGLAAASLCTLAGWLFRGRGDLSFYIMIFLVGSVLTALWRGRLAATVAAVAGMVAFDYFFETPAFELSVADWPNFLVFTGFLAIALLVGSLVHRLRGQTRQAQLRERETAALYALAGILSAQASSEDLQRVAERTLSELLKVPVRILASEGAPATSVALQGSGGPLGALWVDGPAPPRSFLEACGRQVALAMERALLAEAAERAHTKAELEQTRSTLLSAISHDFRTPLATIHAAAATLAQETPVLGSPEMSDLARLIVDESSRLDHLVGNLLDMMRLEAGGLSPALELQPLEEVVGTVLTRLEPLLGPITVDLPDDLPSVLLDSVLLEQLLTNLLENAFRHGGGPVCLGARALEGELAVEVSDAGRGVPEVLRERVFEKFYRPPGTRADGGAGLGLAICRAIVQVHGGRIWVEEVPGGGAAFRFTLPLPAAP